MKIKDIQNCPSNEINLVNLHIFKPFNATPFYYRNLEYLQISQNDMTAGTTLEESLTRLVGLRTT